MGLITLGAPFPFRRQALSASPSSSRSCLENASPVAVGGAVEFPQNGLTSGVADSGQSYSFLISSTGTYEVSWQVECDRGSRSTLFNRTVLLNSEVSGRSCHGHVANCGQQIISTTLAT